MTAAVAHKLEGKDKRNLLSSGEWIPSADPVYDFSAIAGTSVPAILSNIPGSPVHVAKAERHATVWILKLPM